MRGVRLLVVLLGAAFSLAGCAVLSFYLGLSDVTVTYRGGAPDAAAAMTVRGARAADGVPATYDGLTPYCTLTPAVVRIPIGGIGMATSTEYDPALGFTLPNECERGTSTDATQYIADFSPGLTKTVVLQPLNFPTAATYDFLVCTFTIGRNRPLAPSTPSGQVEVYPTIEVQLPDEFAEVELMGGWSLEIRDGHPWAIIEDLKMPVAQLIKYYAFPDYTVAQIEAPQANPALSDAIAGLFQYVYLYGETLPAIYGNTGSPWIYHVEEEGGSIDLTAFGMGSGIWSYEDLPKNYTLLRMPAEPLDVDMSDNTLGLELSFDATDLIQVYGTPASGPDLRLAPDFFYRLSLRMAE